MKKIFILFIIFFSCKNEDIKPRIGIAGIWIEASTFSPISSTEKNFNIKYSSEIFSNYSFFDNSYLDKANWFPSMTARALPGGVVTKSAYESMVLQIMQITKQTLPLDGLILDLHGAMNVEGMDDPEGDFIKRMRHLVGEKTVISTTMDLHGNVSYDLIKNTDLITCYRKAPHEDAMDTKQRSFDNLISRLKNGKGKPKYKAWSDIPILLPGEKTSTRVEPGKSLYGKIDDLVEKNGVIDIGIWTGYAWGDKPRNRAAVVVTGDHKKNVVEATEILADYFWSIRNDFEFVAPTTNLENSIEKAILYLNTRKNKKPFIISDMGDNPTAGGSGDVTWTLNKILNSKLNKVNGPEIIYASIPGPDLIKNALNTKIGDEVSGYVGAVHDDRFSPPILLNGILKSVRLRDVNADAEVVIKVNNINVIVTNRRKPYHYISDFENLDLKPKTSDIIIVKIGYLVPELYDIRGDWLMALTPGGVDQDLLRLDYKEIVRPIFPLDTDFNNPDLSAKLIPKSN